MAGVPFLGRFKERLFGRRGAFFDADNAKKHLELAIAAESAGRRQEAIWHFEKVAEANDRDAVTRRRLGCLYRDLGRLKEAIAYNEASVAIDPSDALSQHELGNTLNSLNRLDEAVGAYERAVELDPSLAAAHSNLGVLLAELGFPIEARTALARAVEIAPERSEYLYALSQFGPALALIPFLKAMERQVLNLESLTERDRTFLHYALARAYVELDRFESALEHLRRGAALKRQEIDYDEAAELELMNRVQRQFSHEFMTERVGIGHPSNRPIFVVGMPRSGTSLVEQILASHSKIFGAGELNTVAMCVGSITTADGRVQFPEIAESLIPVEFHALGARYLENVTASAPSAWRIVDKLPANFLCIGLLNLMLPNARIIHVRRDALETCMSCYSRIFTGSRQAWSYELGELGRHHRAYRELMAHWRSVLPEGVMLDIDYEAIVDDLEGQSRRMVAFCGLDWEQECLSFYRTRRPVRTFSATQVRQPIYRSSIARWRPYAHLLTELVSALEASA